MGPPQNLVRDIDHSAPVLDVGQVVSPICAQIFLVDPVKFGCGPGFGMNAIGDAGYRHLLQWDSGPDILPQPFADFAMELADSVGMTACAQSQDRHAEQLRSVNHWLSQREKLVKAQTKIVRVLAEIT